MKNGIKTIIDITFNRRHLNAVYEQLSLRNVVASFMRRPMNRATTKKGLVPFFLKQSLISQSLNLLVSVFLLSFVPIVLYAGTYGNQFLIDGVDTSYRIDGSTLAVSYRFKAQNSKTVATIRFFTGVYGDTRYYKISLCNDNAGNPGSVIVSTFTTSGTNDSGKWITADIADTAITAGTIYHIVISSAEPDSPPYDINASTYINPRATTLNNQFIPLNQTIDTAFNFLCYVNGAWNLKNLQPVYVLYFTDNSSEGNPYTGATTGAAYNISGSTWTGSEFIVRGNTITIKTIDFYIRKAGTPGGDVWYQLRGPDSFSVLIESGVFAYIANVPTANTWISTTTYVRRTLSMDRKYWVLLNSPGTAATTNTYYQDTLNTYTDTVDPYAKKTYGGEIDAVFCNYIVENNVVTTNARYDVVNRFTTDTESPGGISNLTSVASTQNEGQVKLEWTSPGNDGTVGNLTGTFRINYSSVGIVTSVNFTNTTSTFATVVDISTATTALSYQTTTFFNLNLNTTYWFAIKTADEASNWSVWNSSKDVLTVNTSAWCYVPALKPYPPSGLTHLSNSGTQLTSMQWTNSSIIISSFTLSDPQPTQQVRFYLQVSSTPGFVNKIVDYTSGLGPQITTGYQWPSLTDNGTYWWQVWSGDSDGNISSSTSTTLGVGGDAKLGFDNKVPAGISNLTALASQTAGGEVQIKWTAPGDDGTVGTINNGQFRIKYSSVAIINSANFESPPANYAATTVNISTTALSPLTECTTTFYSLKMGVTYYFAIKTKDKADNWSVWNSSADILTVNTSAWCYVPLIVSPNVTNLKQLTSLVGGTELTSMQWTNSSLIITSFTITDPQPADTVKFQIQVSSDTDFVYKIADYTSAGFGSQGTTDYQWPTLTNYGTYWWRVWAYDNSNNTSSTSTTLGIGGVAKLGFDNRPTAPSNLAPMNVGVSSIQWRFTDNADNETGLYISSDNYTRLSENLGPLSGAGLTTSWWEINLGTNTPCTRYAEAYNASGSRWSASITSYTLAAVPSSLVATTSTTASIKLDWNVNQNPNGTKFGIDRSTVPTMASAVTTIVNYSYGLTANTTAHYGLSANTTYYFRLWAYNGDQIETTFISDSTTTAPTPINLLKIANTGFELDPELVSWSKEGTAGSIDRSSTQKRNGEYSCKFDNPTSAYTGRTIVSSSATITESTAYTVGAYFYIDLTAGAITDTQIRIGMRWINNSGAVIYTSTSTDLTLSAFSTWEKLTYSDTAPTGAVQAVMIIQGKETTNNDNDIFIDDVDSAPDTTPPNAITNLSALTGTNPGEINITWTAPGDDGTVGNNLPGSKYDLKYATYSVTSSTIIWWNNAVTYFQEWSVNNRGGTETKILNLNPGTTYWVAIRTIDAARNISALDTGTTAQLDNPSPPTQANTWAQVGTVGSWIRINEVAPSETSTSNPPEDWIEFYNAGPTVNISGWYVSVNNGSVKTFPNFTFNSGTYIVLHFDSSSADEDDLTGDKNPANGYRDFYTTTSGLPSGPSTPADIMITLRNPNANPPIIDAVCISDREGSIKEWTGDTIDSVGYAISEIAGYIISPETNGRKEYNVAVSSSQWTGPAATGSNDSDVEEKCVNWLFGKKTYSVARSNVSLDGTNPSYREWAIATTQTPGTINFVAEPIDTILPGQITDLYVSTGQYRGSITVKFSDVGDDGNTGMVQTYEVKYSKTPINNESDYGKAISWFNGTKENAKDRMRTTNGTKKDFYWAPGTSGSPQEHTIGGLSPDVTYYVCIRGKDEQGNLSPISVGQVSARANDVIGSPVRINEVSPINGAGKDWVEFYNSSGKDMNMSNWEIYVRLFNTSKPYDYYDLVKTFPSDYVLPAGAYVVLNFGDTVSTPDEVPPTDTNNNGYWEIYTDYAQFDDAAGLVTLLDKDGTLVDYMVYSNGVQAWATNYWDDVYFEACLYRQWSPLNLDNYRFDSANIVNINAVDWSGGDETKSLGRDGFSTDTDNTLAAAKADWTIFTTTSPGKQNDNTPPAGISDLTALTGTDDGQIILRWTAPGDDGTVGTVYGYLVKYSIVNKIDAANFDIGTSTYTQSWTGFVSGKNEETRILTLPEAYKTYWFAIKSYDETNNYSVWGSSEDWAGYNTACSTVSGNIAPDPPQAVIAVSSNASINISWTAPSEPDILSYNLYYATWGPNPATYNGTSVPSKNSPINVGSVTTYTLTGLTNGVTYYIALKTVDNTNLESLSYSTEVSTVPRIRPPTLISAVYSGNNVKLTWNHSPDFGATNFSAYNIYRATVSGGPYSLRGSIQTDTTYIDTPSAVAFYYYVLRSSDTSGFESVNSNEVWANPDSIPPEVTHTPITKINVLGGYAVFLATITDTDNTGSVRPVASAKLYYQKTGDTVWIEISTKSITGDVFRFEIGPIDTTFLADFKYYIEAKDSANNNGYFIVSGSSITATNPQQVAVEVKTTATTISSGGGTISVPDGDQTDGETNITIPDGAIRTNVLIEIEQEGYPGDTSLPPVAFKNEQTATIQPGTTGPIVCFDFQPTGTQFKKPVLLTLRYLDQDNDGEVDDRPGISETILRIYWWDNWEWRYIGGTVDPDGRYGRKNTLQAYIDHFTLFALFPVGQVPPKPTAREKFITPATIDGKNDRIQFECETAIKKIEIYDVTGKLIKAIDDGSDNWNGTDEDGNVLESGVYIYKVEAVSGQKRTGAVVLAK